MSTYSSNLRLELITTGTQAGTWGTTTNTNLGTLIEGSVAGYAVVTVTSTSQALTANNGAADEARLAMLQLATSGISSAFAVYAPPATKEYTIYNASSYTATIYNSTVLGNTTAAGTGVSIPAGATMTVWSNGTSFFQQNSYLNSVTLNAPTITGVSAAPTASFGTNTTQLATTAFVQVALQALHPVGSIYTSTSSTNPGTSFGFGTWVAYGAGRVLIGNGGGYTAGSTGGSADAIVVSHTHTATSSFTGSTGYTDTGGVDHTHNLSFSTGTESLAHSHAIFISDPGHQHSIGMPGLQPGQYGEISNQANRSQAGWGNAQSSTQSNLTDSRTTSITASSGTESTTHTHYVSGTSQGASAYSHGHFFTPSGSVSTSVTATGSSGTGANLPPYVVVYMWNRTA